MLTSWVTSMKIPEGTGERQTRPSMQALRRSRRGAFALLGRPSAGGAPLVDAAGAPSSSTAVPVISVGRDGKPLQTDRESGQAPAKGAGRRRGIGPRETESGHGIGPTPPDPWAARIQKVRAALDRARRFQGWMLAQADRTAADVARREKLTRARVSQLLRLLKLAPEIIADIDRPGRTGRVLGELELRQLAGLGRKEQLKLYRAKLGLDEQGKVTAEGRAAEAEVRPQQARNRGLAQHLARARRYRELVESGRFQTMTELAMSEGVSVSRVSQLLNLLDLHPDIIAAIDVPQEREPSVTERELRKIAVILDKDRQIREWRRLNPTDR